MVGQTQLTPLVSRNVGIPELMALAKMLWSRAFGSAAASRPATAMSDWLSLPVEVLSLSPRDGASPPGDCIDGVKH